MNHEQYRDHIEGRVSNESSGMTAQMLRSEFASRKEAHDKNFADIQARVDAGKGEWTREEHDNHVSEGQKIQAIGDRIVREEARSSGPPPMPAISTNPFLDPQGRSVEEIQSDQQGGDLSPELRTLERELNFAHWLRTGNDPFGFPQQRMYINFNLGDTRHSSKMQENVRLLAEKGNALARHFVQAEEIRSQAYMAQLQNNLSQQLRVTGGQLAGTAADGGNTVPDESMRQLVKEMKRYNSVQGAGITTFNTATGADLPIPTMDDTKNEGEQIAEAADVTRQSVEFGQIVMKAWKYSSKEIVWSLEFMQDTVLDLNSWVMDVVAERLGRFMNKRMTLGTGSGQAEGVVTAASAGVSKANTVTDPTYADLVDLFVSIDGAYVDSSSVWMFNRNTLGKTMKITGTQGQPLWFPSTAPGIPPSLLTHGYIENDNMDSYGTGKKPILFGNFRRYYNRMVSMIELYSLGTNYITSGQLGVIAFMRHDARSIKAATNQTAWKALAVA